MIRQMNFNILIFNCLFILALARISAAGWVTQTSGTLQNLNDITASHGDIETAWACGDNGTMLYTSNGGQSWQLQSPGTTAKLNSIAFIEAVDAPVMAVGDSGIILITLDSGATWQRQISPTTENLRCLSDDGLSAVGDHGTVLVRQELRDPWALLPCPTTVRLNAVSGFFIPLLISGDSGVVLRRFGTSTWQVCSTGTTANLYGIPMFSVSNLIVGDSGLLLRSGDFGLHWSRQASHVTVNLRATEFSSNNTSHVYAVGYSGTIIKTTDEGVNWVRQESGTQHNLRGVFFYLDDNNGWVVGDSGTILRTRDGGVSTTNIEDRAAVIPGVMTLEQNYPNPFNPVTTIEYRLEQSGLVNLKIYNLQGQEVATVFTGEQTAGNHRIDFAAGSLAGGVYVYRLTALGHTEARKMLLIK
jgi:photosystem II stability/assembly factor-like uncharacterized protein